MKKEEISKVLDIVMKNAGVEVKDMPAFPPAKMSALDVVGLAVKIGIVKAKKEERERIQNLIVKEITICQQKSQPTSGLTSLYNKIN